VTVEVIMLVVRIVDVLAVTVRVVVVVAHRL
jgi:hypothetical protein